MKKIFCDKFSALKIGKLNKLVSKDSGVWIKKYTEKKNWNINIQNKTNFLKKSKKKIVIPFFSFLLSKHKLKTFVLLHLTLLKE